MKKIGLLLLSILTMFFLFLGCKSSNDILTLGKKTDIEIKKVQISKDQSYGADMVSLDYASDEVIIFHGYFGLFVYSLNNSKIINSIDLQPIGCNATQGDNYCEVSVSKDGRIVQLHNTSSKDMYVYSVEKNTLIKKEYKPLENPFELSLTPEAIMNSSSLCSFESVKFKNGDIGYLVLTDNTINSLEYIRSNKRFKIFTK